MSQTPRKYRQLPPFLVSAAVVTGVLWLGLWLALFRGLTIWALAAPYLGAVNVAAFGFYGFDKRRAQSGGRRVPEAVLHALTAAGGAVGAFAAMRYFRHKTIKGSFRVVFWALVVFQVAVMLAIGKRVLLG